MKEPRRSPRLAEKGNKVSVLQTMVWFMMATFGGLAMTQNPDTTISAFNTHDVRTPCMDNVTTLNDINIKVKSTKTSTFSKKELQQLFYTEHVDSF